jgi:hypothetical protein
MAIAGIGETAGGGVPGAGGGPTMSVSPLPNRRPCSACTMSAFSRCSSTLAERARSGASPAVTLTSPVV